MQLKVKNSWRKNVGENEQIMHRFIYYDLLHALQLQKLNLDKNVSLATSRHANIQNSSWEWSKLLNLKLWET